MTSRSLLCIALAGMALTLSCGGDDTPSRPTTTATPVPTPTPASPLSIVDGVTGARLSVSGAPTTPALGAALSLEAPGYLLRAQKYDGRAVALWPGDQNYVNGMVYWGQFSDGVYRLIRWRDTFTITLDGDLATDPFLVQAAEEAAAELRRVTGLPIRVGPGGECVIRVNPKDPILQDFYIAYSQNRYQGATIVGNEIVFARRSEIAGLPGTNYRNTLLHELGHTLGLGHSGSGFDVMDPGGSRHPGGKRPNFSDNETAVIQMMYVHRKAGNRPPDADPELFASSFQARTRIIID